jgi:hypothetical protein
MTTPSSAPFNSFPEEEPTPIERAWGDHLIVTPGTACLEADVLISLAERGRSSSAWASGMDHISRCPHCRERYRETLALTKRTPIATVLPAPATRPAWKEVFRNQGGSFLAGAAMAAILLWAIFLRNSNSDVRTLEQRLTKIAQERDQKATQLQSVEEGLVKERQRLQKAQQVNEKTLQRQRKQATEAQRLRTIIAAQNAQAERLRQQLDRSKPSLAATPTGTRQIASITLPNLAYLASAPVSPLRGGPEGEAKIVSGITPVYPVATRVRPARTTFHWLPFQEVQGAYRLTITDTETGAVILTGQTKGNVWTSPRPLPAGKKLRWWVEAQAKEQVPSPSAPVLVRSSYAFVQTLSPGETAKIDTALKAEQGQVLNTAATLAEAGLFAEAMVALQYYALTHPEDKTASSLYQKLLKAVTANPSLTNK